jgi:transcriptional regulator with XRE-family HTH domain
MTPGDLFRLALEWHLRQKKMTQAQLAESLGIKRTVMNDFLRGRRNFSEKRKQIIAEAFDTTFEDMFILGRRIADIKEGKDDIADSNAYYAEISAGVGIQDSIEAEILPMGRAREILKKALKETGKTISERKQEKITLLIAKEIARNENQVMKSTIGFLSLLADDRK